MRVSDGDFCGVRVNVESVLRLPTFPARWVFGDPRRRPYFVFWTDDDGELEYALKMAPSDDGAAVPVTLEDSEVSQSNSSAVRCRGELPGVVAKYAAAPTGSSPT